MTIFLLLRLLPVLFPFALAVFKRLFALMRFSLKALVTGPKQFIERLASEWTNWLLASGVSRDHMDNAYRFCLFLATSLIILGWVVTTLFLVAILRIVFGLFT